MAPLTLTKEEHEVLSLIDPKLASEFCKTESGYRYSRLRTHEADWFLEDVMRLTRSRRYHHRTAVAIESPAGRSLIEKMREATP